MADGYFCSETSCMMNALYKIAAGLFFLFSFCYCSPKKDKVPVGADQQLYLPGMGFIKGPVVRIEQVLRNEKTGHSESVYTLDYATRTFTIDNRETNAREVYYLDKAYRPDSLVSEDKHGRRVAVYFPMPVYHNLVSYHTYDRLVTDSVLYTIDSSDRAAIRITSISSLDPGRKTTTCYDAKRRLTGSVSSVAHSADSVKSRYEYDSMGNVKRIVQEGRAGILIAESRVTRKDDRGNWLEMETIYYDGNGNRRGVSDARRTITYAD